MKLTQTILATTLFCLAIPSLAAEEPDRELKDFIAYFRSIRTPTVVEMCTPIVDDKEGFALAASNWLQANTEAIARGRNVALSRMPSEQHLNNSNTAMLVDLKDDFARMTQEGKAEFCSTSRASYKPQPKTN